MPGKRSHLDWINHEKLHPKCAHWLVYAAPNCTSIGCPALRPQTFTA